MYTFTTYLLSHKIIQNIFWKGVFIYIQRKEKKIVHASIAINGTPHRFSKLQNQQNRTVSEETKIHCPHQGVFIYIYKEKKKNVHALIALNGTPHRFLKLQNQQNGTVSEETKIHCPHQGVFICIQRKEKNCTCFDCPKWYT